MSQPLEKQPALELGATLDQPGNLYTKPENTSHPKGLWVLFGTEMWERFNFYGMRALLTLFMVNSLLMKEADATLVYSGFLALCYLTPMLGGFIADRYLGNRSCILMGGLMMAAGQFMLFGSATIFDNGLDAAKTMMWVGMAVIIFGNGFFKPNISSMVGSLYPKQDRNKLDKAFTIFYMGINLGAFLGQFICPIIGDVKNKIKLPDGSFKKLSDGSFDMARDIHAFKWGFLAAGCAMLLGSVIFLILKNKYVVTPEGQAIGARPSKNKVVVADDEDAQEVKFTTKSLVIAVVAFIAMFFAFHYMTGGTNVVKTIIYPIIYSCGLTLAGLILSDQSLTKVERQRIWVIYIVSFFVIFFWAAFEQAGSSLTFIADNQTDRHIFGWDMPPSMVQIFNGLFVVILAVPFSILWSKLSKANREPISPMKQSIGLLLIAVSYFIIANNVKDLGTTGLLAVKWLILLYFIQTCAELCLSPIGLSLVGKLSPKRFASLLYGVFFLSNAAGYALAGTLGAILPPTNDKYKEATEQGVDLKAILDHTKEASGQELFTLAQMNIASVDGEKAKAANVDIQPILDANNKTIDSMKKVDKTITLKVADLKQPTAEQLTKIQQQKVIGVEYPSFAGKTIHNLFEFFMVFVVLTGIASVLLFLIVPFLKKMMNGVR